MSLSIYIRKEAEADIEEAYVYYESCRENLGSDFILCVEESLSRIPKNPAQFKINYKNIHRALVRRFPYGIFYISTNTTVPVIGVLHARKNPNHWKKRT